VIEAFRICPTVTTVHRIVEADEKLEIRGRARTLRAGDEVAYPFVCINRDPRVFTTPEEFRLDRSPSESAQVLSWSAGPHACPAKDLSIVSSVLMLDTLAAARGDLRRLKIFNLEF
jgi:cytochrome P450